MPGTEARTAWLFAASFEIWRRPAEILQLRTGHPSSVPSSATVSITQRTSPAEHDQANPPGGGFRDDLEFSS